MLVIRLPKRSTRSTSPSIASVVDARLRRRRAARSRAGRAAERRQLDALRQPGRGGREAVAPFERAADRRPRVPPLGQLDDAPRRRSSNTTRQHAVVRRHEPVVAGVGGDAAARRADARIDDDQKDRAGRKVAIGGGELERAGDDVVRRRCRARCRRASRRGRCRARRPSSCRRSGRAVPKSVSSAIDRPRHGCVGSRARFVASRLAEQNFADVVLQQERIGHAQAAANSRMMSRFEQDGLPAARRRIRPVLQVRLRRR